MTDRTSRERALERATASAASHFSLCLALTAARLAGALRGLSGPTRELAEHPLFEGWTEALAARSGGESEEADLLRELLLWEQTAPASLPLVRLSTALGLPREARFLLLGAGLVEEDARFGDLLARLQGGPRRPLLEILARLFGDESEPDLWRQVAPLVDLGLLEPHDRSAPRSEWSLSVPSTVWEVIRGDPPSRTSGQVFRPPQGAPLLETLVLEPEVVERVSRTLPLLVRGELHTIILRGGPGSSGEELAAAIARALGRGTLATDARELTKPGSRLGTVAALLGASPLLRADLAPGETVALAEHHAGASPLFVALGPTGGVEGEAARGAWTITLPPLRRVRREIVWRRVLGDHPIVPALAERHQLSGTHLVRLAELTKLEATARGDEVTEDDARRASALLQREHLDTLAERVDVQGDWRRLVVGAGTWTRLRELELRCRRREAILDHLGPGFSGARTRGVRALLSGASGTGKTLAARLLASVLRMDLYRVDLSAVVNKYIGETEKNLHRVLSYAEALDVVLLLDEGDSLLGGRTEVRSANDRYANMETNYLLQRLESYDGILLVTTNAQDQIDRAFRRRMDVVVPFAPPGPEERYGIWSLHLPLDHRVDHDWLRDLTRRFPLTGGQIRNAAEHATLLALDEQRTVDAAHVEAALRSERQKAGATWPRAAPVEDGAVEAFFGALTR